MSKQKYLMSMVSGEFGSGKTLFLTHIAKETYKSYKHVYANYHLFNIDNFIFLKRINENIIKNLEQDSLLLINEAYHYFDKRFCMKKENTKTANALMQIRKYHIDMFFDIFDFDYLDLRVRSFTNSYIRAEGEVEKDIFLYRIYKHDKDTFEFYKTKNVLLIDMKKTYKYYDTFEIVEKYPTLSKWQQKITI